MLFLYFIIIHLWVSSQCISKDRFPLGSHSLQKNRTVYFSNTWVEHFAVGGSTVFTCWTEALSIDWLSYEKPRAFEEFSCTGGGWIRVFLLFNSWLRVWSYLYSHQFRNNWFPTFQSTGISLYWFLLLFLYRHPYFGNRREVFSKLSRGGDGEFNTYIVYSLYLQRCQPLEM